MIWRVAGGLAQAVPPWCWCLAALILVGGAQQYRVVVARGETDTARAELADYRRQVAERDLRAAVDARTEEQRRYAAAHDQGETARETSRQIDRDVADRSADDGLRNDAADVALRASGCPVHTATAERSDAARRAAMVLTDLLERSVATNRELAEAYDRARNAALTCTRTVDAWRRAQ